jgi:hypothetical protein
VGLAPQLQGGNFQKDTEYAIGIPVVNPAATVLTLTMSADSLRYTIKLSPGKFEYAQLCPGEPAYKTIPCASFEPLKARGYLHAKVRNVGKLPASYQVQVRRCSTAADACWCVSG